MRFRFPGATILFLVFVSIFIPSCKAQKQSQLQGVITLHAEWKPMVYLIQPRHFQEVVADYLGVVIDSADILPDGSFAFEHLPSNNNPTLYILSIQPTGSRFANHLVDESPEKANYMPVVLHPKEQIKINARSDAFHTSYLMEHPTMDNQTLLRLRDIRLAAFKDYIHISAGDEDNETLLLEREKNYMDYIGHLMAFADNTSSLHAALVAIRWISPSGDYERVPEFIYRQCQRWNKDHADVILVKELCGLSGDGKMPVMIGDEMPDFPMPLAAGDTVALRKLCGKKLTIVDVWASWCAPCRKENRVYLAPLYASYRDKGLQIIGYSIDNDHQAWQKAIAKDQAVWIQASHLTGDSTPFMDALRISTIPVNFILDSKGKVIAKNVYGEELHNLIRGIFE
jgi:thiol-disulfide isomerase/thioredoxin